MPSTDLHNVCVAHVALTITILSTAVALHSLIFAIRFRNSRPSALLKLHDATATQLLRRFDHTPVLPTSAEQIRAAPWPFSAMFRPEIRHTHVFTPLALVANTCTPLVVPSTIVCNALSLAPQSNGCPTSRHRPSPQPRMCSFPVPSNHIRPLFSYARSTSVFTHYSLPSLHFQHGLHLMTSSTPHFPPMPFYLHIQGHQLSHPGKLLGGYFNHPFHRIRLYCQYTSVDGYSHLRNKDRYSDGILSSSSDPPD